MLPTQGTITLDGVSYTDLPVKFIRSHFGIVTQDISLFEGNILSNIFPKLDPPELESLPASTLEQLICILEEVDFLRHFKSQKKLLQIDLAEATEGTQQTRREMIRKSLTKKIDINSANFSKGQCQMISFIRAIMSESRVLLLDEATSSIDILTEKSIEDAVNREIREKGRSALVIAHRIETVKNCDRIYALGSDGNIAGVGKWEEICDLVL